MSTKDAPSFETFGLSDPLLKDLARIGFATPTPIQEKALPPALDGRDILGCAQTGTGKTAAFVIPMVERLAGSPEGPPRGLILAPTRELAYQIQETIDQLGRSLRVYATTVVGGADVQAQLRGLKQHPEIIVATPGRLLDLMWDGHIDLREVEVVVLDEADRMLDMGFADQLNQIIDALPPGRQSFLYSATLPTDLEELARMSLQDPFHAVVAKSATPADGITHMLHDTTPGAKTSLLLSLLLKDTHESVLVFTRTKNRADLIGETLRRSGHRAAAIHGNLSLERRRAALEGFRRGRYRILVATDIAARGLDIDNIGHVINYDLPYTPEDYVHRIGRTARMAAVGRATSFATAADTQSVRAIETILGQSIPRPSSGQTDKKRLARNGSPEAPEAKRTRPAGNRRRPRKHTGQPGVRAEHRTEPAAILAAPVTDQP
jgi:ATP-dependent RNA helicase RhlE